MKSKSAVLLLALAPFTTIFVRAADVQSSFVGNSTGESDVITEGLPLYAYSFGQASGGTLELNGETFTQVTLNSSKTRLAHSGATLPGNAGIPWIFDNVFDGYLAGSLANTPYGTMLGSGIFRGGGSSTSYFSVGGLDPGATYVVQLWVNDSRNQSYSKSRYLKVKVAAGTDLSAAGDGSLAGGTDFIDLGTAKYQMEDSGVGQFVTAYLTLGELETALRFSLQGVDSEGSGKVNTQQINGFQIRRVFEDVEVDFPEDSLYWDVNGALEGSGNAGGVWNEGNLWTADPAGASPSGPWEDGRTAVFSAGTDGRGDWTVTVEGTVNPAAVYFGNPGDKVIAGGTIQLDGGTVDSRAAGFLSVPAIDSSIVSAAGLTIRANGSASGSGMGSPACLELRGDNEIQGEIVIETGLVGAGSNFGGADRLVLGGSGLLDYDANADVGTGIEVPPGATGYWRTDGQTENARLSGALTGGGTLARIGGNATVATLAGDGSGFTGSIVNFSGRLVVAGASWADAEFSQTDGLNELVFAAPGDTRIRALWSDRDVIIPAGSRLDIVSGEYDATEAGGVVNNFQLRGTEAGDPASAGALTSSLGTLTFTSGLETGGLLTGEQRFLLPLTDYDAATPLLFVKNNSRELILEAANTHGGGTEINGGRITATHPQAFGDGSVWIAGEAQAALAGGPSALYDNNFEINGVGPSEASGALGAIRFTNNETISGSVHVASPARIVATNSSGTLAGPITGTEDIEIGILGANGVITASGDSPAYSGRFIVNESNTLILSGVSGGGVTNHARTIISGSLQGDLETLWGVTDIIGDVAGEIVVQGGTLNAHDGVVLDPSRLFLEGAVLNLHPGSSIGAGFESRSDLTLNLGGSVGGDLHLGAGDVLGLEGGSINGNLIWTGSGDLVFSSPVTVAGYLYIDGPLWLSVSEYPEPGQVLTLFHYGGSYTYSNDPAHLAEDLKSQPGFPYRDVTVIHDSGAKTLSLDLHTAALVWKGAYNAVVNTENPNWTGADGLFHPGDSMLFDETADEFNLAIAGVLTPSSIIFNVPSGFSYHIDGANAGFAGATGITKNGEGSLYLGGQANEFTGPVQINAGLLRIEKSESLGRSSGVTVAPGACLDLDGHSPYKWGQREYTITIAGDGGDGPGNRGALTNSQKNIGSEAGVLNLVLSADAEIGGGPGGARFDVGRTGRSGVLEGNGFTLTKTGADKVVIAAAESRDVHFIAEGGELVFEDHGGAAGTNPIAVRPGAAVGSAGGAFQPVFPNDLNLDDGARLICDNHIAEWAGAVTLTGGESTFAANAGNAETELRITGPVGGSGGLVKTGTGLLLLAGENTYAGPTTVKNGTLALNGGSLPAGTTLMVEAGRVELRGNETAAALVLEGVSAGNGTYGAPGSGAQYTDAVHFSGTGILSVGGDLPEPAGYQDWIAGFGFTGEAASANADPDGDGLPNAVEWVLGGNPADGSDAAGIAPSAGRDQGDFVFTFIRQQTTAAVARVTIELSTDLGAWTDSRPVGADSAGSGDGVTVTDNGDGTDTVELRVNSGLSPHLFARMRVFLNQ